MLAANDFLAGKGIFFVGAYDGYAACIIDGKTGLVDVYNEANLMHQSFQPTDRKSFAEWCRRSEETKRFDFAIWDRWKNRFDRWAAEHQ